MEENKNKIAELVNKGKGQPMDRVILAVKVIQVLSAILLVVAALIRVGSIENFRTWWGFLLTGYLFMFGVIFLTVEFAMYRAPVWFFFLNFMWGKAVTYLFIGTLEFWGGLEVAWIDVLAGIWFVVFGVLFIVFCGVYRGQEWERV